MAYSSLSHFTVKNQYSAQQNAEWQAVIKADVLRKRQQDIIGDTFLSYSDVPQPLISSITTDRISEVPTKISGRIQSITRMTTLMPTRQQVCEEFTLNNEQARAFYIVCRHADGESHLRKGEIRSFILSLTVSLI